MTSDLLTAEPTDDPWGRQPGDDDASPPPRPVDPELGVLTPLGELLDQAAAETTARAELAVAPMSKALPPSALDAERAVLGAILLEPSTWPAIASQRLTAEDFFRPAHSQVFQAIRTLAVRGQHIDTLTVVDELLRLGQLDAVGGAAAVSQLEAMLPTAAHASSYARLVREKAVLRRAIETGRALAKQAYRHQPPVEVIHQAQAALSELASLANAGNERPIVDRMATVAEVANAGVEGKDPPGALPTGFPAIDRYLRGGPRPGQFVLVAARPGMGKTIAGHQIAEHVADAGHTVTFISCEMSGPELLEREIARASRLTYDAWRLPQNSGALAHGAAIVAERKRLRIHDWPAIPIGELTALARREVKEHGTKLLVVDHLGLVKASDRYAGDRTNEVGEISSTLRALAGELQIPVLALSQLNREVEKRKVRRPMLADLRDSGTLEQDAQAILFIYRPEYYLELDGVPVPRELQRLAEIIIAKNRGGQTGDVRLIFDGPTTRFITPKGEDDEQ